ncbi:MAG: RNA-binding S4 domain-containing protein [Proteobacteria bacterium]|nr:RNA-binding S4 domain-containing protein [Pseudomonadota bacterium]
MPDNHTAPSVRLDKWLWYARFFKSRSLATKLVLARKVRINSVPTDKPSAAVKSEDVLTFPQGKNIRVIRILNVGSRRGPATEAQSLYEDLAPIDAKKKTDPSTSPVARRDAGSGRPTKAQRRALDRMRDNSEDPENSF